MIDNILKKLDKISNIDKTLYFKTLDEFNTKLNKILNKNNIEQLPNEIIVKILSYINIEDLFRLKFVFKNLHDIINRCINYRKSYYIEIKKNKW